MTYGDRPERLTPAPHASHMVHPPSPVTTADRPKRFSIQGLTRPGVVSPLAGCTTYFRHSIEMAQETRRDPTTLIRRRRPKPITAKRTARSRAAKLTKAATTYAPNDGRNSEFKGRSNCNFRMARAPET